MCDGDDLATVAQWTGAGRWRNWWWKFKQRRALQPCHWQLERHRVDVHCTTGSYRDAVASGVVLVAGGVMSGGGRTSSVEVYNPTTGNWSSDASLIVARDSSTATLLPNGKVLVAAGQSGPLVPTGSAELFACVATPCPTGA